MLYKYYTVKPCFKLFESLDYKIFKNFEKSTNLSNVRSRVFQSYRNRKPAKFKYIMPSESC